MMNPTSRKKQSPAPLALQQESVGLIRNGSFIPVFGVCYFFVIVFLEGIFII